MLKLLSLVPAAWLVVIVAVAASEARTAVAQDSPASVTIRIESVVSEVGAEATVAVEAKDITGSLDAWAIIISYDPDVVAAVSCTVHAGGACRAESDVGTVEVVSIDSAGLVKDTVLATVTFRCENQGTTDLSLTNQLGGVPEDIGEVQTEDGAISCEEASVATEEDLRPTTTPQPSLPETGTGSGSGGRGLTWLIAALAGTGLAIMAGGTLRLRPRKIAQEAPSSENKE